MGLLSKISSLGLELVCKPIFFHFLSFSYPHAHLCVIQSMWHAGLLVYLHVCICRISFCRWWRVEKLLIFGFVVVLGSLDTLEFIQSIYSPFISRLVFNTPLVCFYKPIFSEDMLDFLGLIFGQLSLKSFVWLWVLGFPISNLFEGHLFDRVYIVFQ